MLQMSARFDLQGTTSTHSLEQKLRACLSASAAIYDQRSPEDLIASSPKYEKLIQILLLLSEIPLYGPAQVKLVLPSGGVLSLSVESWDNGGRGSEIQRSFQLTIQPRSSDPGTGGGSQWRICDEPRENSTATEERLTSQIIAFKYAHPSKLSWMFCPCCGEGLKMGLLGSRPILKRSDDI